MTKVRAVPRSAALDPVGGMTVRLLLPDIGLDELRGRIGG